MEQSLRNSIYDKVLFAYKAGAILLLLGNYFGALVSSVLLDGITAIGSFSLIPQIYL